MNHIKFRAIVRRIYHGLPLSQRTKWYLRQKLQPLFLIFQGSANASALVKAVGKYVIDGANTPSLKRDYECELALSKIIRIIAEQSTKFGPASNWLALPFLSTGGAELVAINFAKAIRDLKSHQSVVLLVTDRSLVSDQVAIPDGVTVISFDDYLRPHTSYVRKQNLLRDLLLALKPHSFHNINSEVAWNLILEEGDRLKKLVNIYASIFAFQFAADGKQKVGYAAYFLKKGMPHLTALLSDNNRFIQDATLEYAFDEATRNRMLAVYQPCRLLDAEDAGKIMFVPDFDDSHPKNIRPKVLWAGRLDAEKRVDLFLRIVEVYDQADFHVFGHVVLNDGVGLPSLPNLFYEGGFSSPFQWVEQHHFDAFLFTSKWEGMPNILLEVGALGIPIIAPVVGGVIELITNETGYPLSVDPSDKDYADALNSIFSDTNEARRRARALYNLINQRHGWRSFVATVAEVSGYLNDDNETDPGQRMSLVSNDSPTITVVIPCYNQGRFLYECVQSVLAACTESLEIIIVDDGSTDKKTGQYLSEAKSLAPDLIVLHRQTNAGLSGARNTGVALAKGAFIQFLDADDILTPEKIDRQINQFRCNPKIDVSVCNFVLCDENRNEFTKSEEAIAKFDLTLDDFLFTWERGFAIPIHCGLFRRSLIKGHLFDTGARAKEDWMFWTGLALEGVCFAYLNCHMAVYRQHSHSMRRSYMNMGKSWLEAGLKINSKLDGRSPLFFESVVSWFEQCYRSSPQYRSEIASLQRPETMAESKVPKDNTEPMVATSISLLIDAPFVISESLIGRLSSCLTGSAVPVISVVVPIYGHFDYLEKCLASIANQGNISIEVICIDDASIDPQVTKLMNLLENKLDRLTIIVNEVNMGISNCQNKAVSLAKGKYIAFLDCDDELEPGAFSVINEQIQSYPEVDYFFTDRKDIDESGATVRVAAYGGYENIHFTSQQEIRADLLDGMVASHLKIIKKEKYIAVGGCNAKFSGVQDWDLALKIAEHGRMQYVPQALYRHRVHSHSVTASDTVAQFRKTNIVRRLFSESWLKQKSVAYDSSKIKYFETEQFPVDLAQLKQSIQEGWRCVAVVGGEPSIGQTNFLREYNSYFDYIKWDDPTLPAALYGYVWDLGILKLSSSVHHEI
ncbi:glycosyltransferase [Glaciimonas sp. CA11.2]|uniref:glycosyltransferase n=2 Tax=Glaciimonas sp. CA11.2 TaxID=3048601 RepID=UPI002AB35E36|nr:glycosyltransferase [Glaciimonas sp. CA11.2]MDY7545049.1 glycosyltransferase [Glaciimonas sp. CA11.2]